MEKENQHLKELIYIANSNYESLENDLEETNTQVRIIEL